MMPIVTNKMESNTAAPLVITLQDIGKRFLREWIFSHVNYTFRQGNAYAITGSNGSGKSTLLQIIAGSTSPTLGTITYAPTSQPNIPIEAWYRQVAIAAPYIELIEEFTLAEMLLFHHRLQPFLPSFSLSSVADYMGLSAAYHKPIRYFSSGMKQRVKLALALLTQVPVVLLDEPTTNLDHAGAKWYLATVAKFAPQKLLIIASNQSEEYSFGCEILNISDFKKNNAVVV